MIFFYIKNLLFEIISPLSNYLRYDISWCNKIPLFFLKMFNHFIAYSFRSCYGIKNFKIMLPICDMSAEDLHKKNWVVREIQ